MLDENSKYVFVFYHRGLNKALRIKARSEIMEAHRPIASLKEKIRQKTASEEDISLFWKINKRHVKLILELTDNDLFTVDRFDMTLLIKLNPFEGIYVPKFNQQGASCASQWDDREGRFVIEQGDGA